MRHRAMPMQAAKTRRSFSAATTLVHAMVQADQVSRERQQAMFGSLAGLMLPPAIIALYLVKSALGINLLPGPSPLHDLFYHLVR